MKNIIKSFLSVTLVASMLFSLTACAGVKEYDKKEVKSILKDELDLKADDDFYSYDWDDYESFYGSYGKASFRVYIYDDEDDALDFFEDLVDDFQDDKDDGVFSGRTKCVTSKTSGYITFSGEADDDGDFFAEDEYYYGGIYYNGCMVIIVTADKDKDSAREDVQAFLKAFGLPRP